MSYLKSLYSQVRDLLEKEGYKEASRICLPQYMSDEIVDHDNLYGGIDTYNIYIDIPYYKFGKLKKEGNLDNYEKIICDAFSDLKKDDVSYQFIVIIRPRNKMNKYDKNISESEMGFEFHFEVSQYKNKYFYINRNTNKEYPYAALEFDSGWNDYGYMNEYKLVYLKDENTTFDIGWLKLMCINEYNSFNVIPKNFKYLDNSYCSLGMNTDYYEEMYKYLGEKRSREVLTALRDSAINIDIHDSFREDKQFKSSLLREASSERALREGKFVIRGISMNNAYSFEYGFHPPYNEDSCAYWTVNFEQKNNQLLRSVGIIGDNGVGKTCLFRQMINDLTREGTGNFRKKPLYSCVISISTTPYDRYSEINDLSLNIPYTACIIEQQDDFTVDQLSEAINTVIERGNVNNESFFNIYNSKIKQIFGDKLSEDIFHYENNGKPILDDQGLRKYIEIMSSGQLQMFSLITHIFSNVRFDTLFVIDEPEVHLHPYAIMQLFEILSNILQDFESYAIIATHSPIVVREMVGRNVYTLRRMDGDIALIDKIDIETLGEDISILYKRIFKYDESKSSFRQIVKAMVKNGDTYEDIVEYLTTSDLPLSMNSKFIIRNIIMENRKYEKS